MAPTQQTSDSAGLENASPFDLDTASLRMINRILLAVTVILMLVVLYRVQHFNAQALTRLPAESLAVQPMAVSPVQEFRPKSYYLEKIRGKKLFTPRRTATQDDEAAAVDQQQDEGRQKLDQLKNNLVIVGVAWEEPRMVMLYNKQRRKTYFLHKSQQIGGTGFRVKKISREAIVVGNDKIEEHL